MRIAGGFKTAASHFMQPNKDYSYNASEVDNISKFNMGDEFKIKHTLLSVPQSTAWFEAGFTDSNVSAVKKYSLWFIAWNVTNNSQHKALLSKHYYTIWLWLNQTIA